MPESAKELRLGLVCYGGSSLAIYMHGVTKEIHRLVKASAIRASGEAPTHPSERVYAGLLDELTSGSDTAPDLRVIVDVIAGTSAGGINGIYLAKALAMNLSLDELRALWFERADMNELVIGPRKIPILGTKISWKAKLPIVLFRGLKRSPLRGDDMSRWLHSALVEMDRAGNQPPAINSLLPPSHTLDLFVTITDYWGYERLIPLSRPKFVPDARHRHVLNFQHTQPGRSDFGDNAGLAFAARTTSCFPGVFPPVNPAKFRAAIGRRLTTLIERSFRIYALSGADPDKTFFVDGGVLDNKPFGWAIDTIIRRRPAESEIDRRLLYIEPDPGERQLRQGGGDPDTIEAALGAMSSIPRAEPILDDLLGVQAHNERVARIRDIVEANFDRVAALVYPSVVDLDTLTAQPPHNWPWRNWNDTVHARSIQNAGMTYATYLRLKMSSVIDG
jgi:patatin-related protein